MPKKPPCPNPLFKQWLYEWWQEEKDNASSKVGSDKMQHIYKKAYESMSKYPVPLASGQGAQVVQYIGEKIAERLDRKLQEHRRAAAGRPSASPPRSQTGSQYEEAAPPAKKPRKVSKKPYAPTYRSGAYALILALHNAGPDAYLAKKELIVAAGPLCDVSMDIAAAGSTYNYTGWSSMKNLVDKELILKSGGRTAPRFTLSGEGRELAKKLIGIEKRINEGGNTTVALSDHSETEPEGESDDDKFSGYGIPRGTGERAWSDFAPQSYEVAIVMDMREVKGRVDRDFFQNQFARMNLPFVTRSLELGDFTWIARRKGANGMVDDEIVLDYIIERKTLDDLVSSIKDGRYKEQKFRLNKSGAKVFYLVEQASFVLAEVFGLSGICTAVTQTQVRDGFFLKRTCSIEETAEYLASLTRTLAERFRGRDLYAVRATDIEPINFRAICEPLETRDSRRHYLTFEAFQMVHRKSKNLVLKDLWTKQVMTFRGVSAEKASVLVMTYPTMKSLLDAYDRCETAQQREKLLTTLGVSGRKAFGPVLSKRVFEIMCSEKY
ncbi:hypothetical protein BDK51DRAFT_18436 [Blyttiomyces helicus]|uniref:Crossover junction endonuclease MUS81 n=1 Tax=Blyttiomyces helicus TaxID=388810 RepID=A0A4P9WM54_9FUNG|nr:hypothetical protein BDK51DRAFT_18436 [Blyttiomyces helicus]|eukprot:RKO92748.1 hypothetical protein BDK51DRAFT_18436 [Blyttiomyces helicus]